MIDIPHIFFYRDSDIYSHHTIDPTPDPDAFSMHAHEWMEIYYFISGSGTYTVEGNQYPLEPNDIFIMRASEAHRLVVASDTPYERIAIHFSPSLLASVDPSGRLLEPFLNRPLGHFNRYAAKDDPGGLLRIPFSGFDFSQVPDIHLNLFARLLFLLTAIRGVYDREQHFPAVSGLPAQIVAYVNEHLFESISLQSVADAFYRSRSQISRVFLQATGSSLWEYVTIKRLLAARAMIQRGETAAEACTACGFSDYSAFYRAYKAHFHHSPRQDAKADLA